jgi:hypothetical protein
MKTEQSTGTLPVARPIDQTSGQVLTEALNDMRRARSELHSRLRMRLSKEANRLIFPPPQWHVKQVQQLDKAYELLRQAESKLELLVLGFGGSV